MPLIRTFSLSALLLTLSAPLLAADAAPEAAQALPAPSTPALQATPSVESAASAAGATAAQVPGAAVLNVPGLSSALGGLVDPQTLALVEQLRALQVTPQQAVGGVGALLGLAQSQLAADQYAQLTGAVPGLELLGGATGVTGAAPGSTASAVGSVASGLGQLSQGLGALGGLLGGKTAQPQAPAQPATPVDSLDGVGQAFSLLGMDTSLVGQFAPILLQFLTGQGLAGALLQSLGTIWGVPGAAAPVLPGTVGATVAGNPVAGTPVVGVPVLGSPVSGIPATGAPAAGAPVITNPQVSTPVAGTPASGSATY